MSASTPADWMQLHAARTKRIRVFLLVLALGILACSFGVWETVEMPPSKPFGEDSPWTLSQERTSSAWNRSDSLSASSLPNAVLVLLGILAALVGAARPSALPAIIPALLSFACTLLIVLFALACNRAGTRVGDAAVVTAAMSLLAGTLTLTLPKPTLAAGPAATGESS